LEGGRKKEEGRRRRGTYGRMERGGVLKDASIEIIREIGMGYG
jgi:hypothetical protein